jgi:hypothetical protein
MKNSTRVRDRRKICNRVVAQLAIEAGVRCDGTGVEQDGISVGIGPCHVFAADVVAGAGLILDEYLLAPHRRKLVCEHARDDIRRTSRGDRNDDAHGFGWVARLRRLRAPRERPRNRRCRRRAAEKRDEVASPHEAHPQGHGLIIAGPGLDRRRASQTKSGDSCPEGRREEKLRELGRALSAVPASPRQDGVRRASVANFFQPRKARVSEHA